MLKLAEINAELTELRAEKMTEQLEFEFIKCAVKLARLGAGYKAPARQCGMP
jgi:hypothetical protein